MSRTRCPHLIDVCFSLVSCNRVLVTPSTRDYDVAPKRRRGIDLRRMDLRTEISHLKVWDFETLQNQSRWTPVLHAATLHALSICIGRDRMPHHLEVADDFVVQRLCSLSRAKAPPTGQFGPGHSRVQSSNA